MAQGGFTVDTDALDNVASRFNDLASNLSTYVPVPSTTLDLGKHSVPEFNDASDLQDHFTPQATALVKNLQTLATELQQLSHAASTLSKQYQNSANADQGSAQEVDSLLGAQPQTSTQ